MKVFYQAILKGALLPAHLAAGISLHELDDHLLTLMFNDEVIATYSATGALVSEIQKDASEWLKRRQNDDAAKHRSGKRTL